MAESTLTTAYNDLRSDVGYFLGYGRTATSWNARQIENVAAVLKAGLRQFYFCGYEWSFLKPILTVTLHNGRNTIDLPDDYASMTGPITVSIAGQSTLYATLMLGPIQEVLSREARMPGTAGPPLVLAEEVLKGTNTVRGQRFQWNVWPTADADYTLSGPYSILPDALTGSLPFAYGGGQHSETLLQSCKAAAERDINGTGAQDPTAVHQPEFARMLAMSQKADRRTKAMTAGYMSDTSDLRRRRVPGASPRPLLPITVQGVLYD